MADTIELSKLHNVDGSCTMSSRGIDIVTSVTGPIESKPRQELPQEVALEVVITPAVGPSATKEKLLEDKLKKILNRVISTHSYPRQLIQIVVQFLRNSDTDPVQTLKYAVNSSYLALIDSGVALKTSYLATACILTESGLVFDFTPEEAAQSLSSFLVVYDLHNGLCNDLVLFESFGDDLPESLLDQVLESSQKNIESYNLEVRKVIAEQVQKDYIWR